MRAVRQDRFGGPDVLELCEVPRPAAIPTEVLVRVHAAGVNPVDWVTRAGDGVFESPPFTLGWDVSGVVEEVGVGVTRFRPGDEVIGLPWFPRQAGAYAEYVTAPSRQFARKPKRLSHVEAGGLPLAGLTAWQVLVDVAALESGQRLLVTAAAGGVGHLAVQIAKARGAYVIGTCRSDKHDFVRDLGADEVIDYTKADVAEQVSGLDVVMDCIGGKHSIGLLPALRPGGLIVPVRDGATPEIEAAAEARDIRTATVLVEPDGTALQHLADLADAGQLRVEVEATYDLAEAGKAHAWGERGRTRGKIVLTTS